MGASALLRNLCSVFSRQCSPQNKQETAMCGGWETLIANEDEERGRMSETIAIRGWLMLPCYDVPIGNLHRVSVDDDEGGRRIYPLHLPAAFAILFFNTEKKYLVDSPVCEEKLYSFFSWNLNIYYEFSCDGFYYFFVFIHIINLETRKEIQFCLQFSFAWIELPCCFGFVSSTGTNIRNTMHVNV